ncbi:Mog1p/PsbP-like protein [Atractiella rhizophila]|nr:Mog1p/PsbP-like protein [Atractiella rhizophila]
MKEPTPNDLEARPLFDGALTLLLPPNLKDASDIRPVPDTQELFVFPDESGRSILFEILEHVCAGEGEEAALRFHFSAQASDSDSTSSTVHSLSLTSSIPTASSTTASSPHPLPPAPLLEGTFEHPRKGLTDAILVLWRLPQHQVDCVLWFFCPRSQSPEEGSMQVVRAWAERARTGLVVRDRGLFVHS